MSRALNLEGQQFGRLTVIKRLSNVYTEGGHLVAHWLCRCSCGKEKVASRGSLTDGKVKSCGCWLIDSAKEKGHKNRTHGLYSKFTSINDRIKYAALCNIKERSQKRGQITDLEMSDLPDISETCPVFNTPFTKGSLKNKDFVPTIDRMNNSLPYLKKYKDNLVFISHKANRLKKDSSLEELEKVLTYMKSRFDVIGVPYRSSRFFRPHLIRSIKDRSRRHGYDSDLEFEDLPTITNSCPVLGIEYDSCGRLSWPSLDRINPNLPYLRKYKDNLRFISYRANELKSNASIREIEQVIAYVKLTLK
jgi:hypothetical protein